MAQTILYVIIAFIICEFAFTKFIAWLNLQTWSKPLPDEMKELYDSAKYEKAKEYATINFTTDLISSTLSLVISVTFLWWKGFAILDEIARNYTTSPILQGIIFFAIIGAVSFVISLPFDIYNTFVTEEKFGFNKVTPKLFILDKIKAIVLAALIGGGILALLTWLYLQLGDNFWLAAWIVVATFTVLLAMFYTSLLLPIFNKLTPLENGELRESIEKYAEKVSFPLTNIMIMDGSKRSTKANAFFSGVGTKKNIVLYDNLVKDMSIPEITAVLAHEVGHYKKKHVLYGLILSVLQMGLMFFLFGWLAANPVMAEVLGAQQNSFHLSLITFALLYSPVSLVVGVLLHIFSRKNEYEADAYAKETYDAAPLISSLKKLSVNHLSNLQPHPAYVFLHYSHPTVLDRVRAMRK